MENDFPKNSLGSFRDVKNLPNCDLQVPGKNYFLTNLNIFEVMKLMSLGLREYIILYVYTSVVRRPDSLLMSGSNKFLILGVTGLRLFFFQWSFVTLGNNLTDVSVRSLFLSFFDLILLFNLVSLVIYEIHRPSFSEHGTT